MTSLPWYFKYFLILFSILASDCKSESDSNTDGEMASGYPHEDAAQLGHEKSEQTYEEWSKYWTAVQTDKSDGIMDVTQGELNILLYFCFRSYTTAK